MSDKRIAVIDLGSNSFYLIIANLLPDGKFEIIERRRIVVRIGNDSEKSEQKILTEKSISKGIRVLKSFKTIAVKYNAQIYAVATSAIREAKNKKQFIDEVQEKVGIKINVISGNEEAKLIYLGAQYGLNLTNKKVMLIDIGGGSTEIIIGKDKEIDFIKSLKLGAVRLTEKFFHNRKTYSEQIERCSLYVRKIVRDKLRKFKVDEVVGTSGTIQSLANTIRVQLNHKARRDFYLHNYRFNKSDFYDLANQILSSKSKKSIAEIDGIDVNRLDILPAGCIILKELFDYFEIERMVVSAFALREGIIVKQLK